MGYDKIKQTYHIQVRSKITLRHFYASTNINIYGFDCSTYVRYTAKADHLFWSKSSQGSRKQALYDSQPSCPQNNIEIRLLFRLLCKHAFQLV